MKRKHSTEISRIMQFLHLEGKQPAAIVISQNNNTEIMEISKSTHTAHCLYNVKC